MAGHKKTSDLTVTVTGGNDCTVLTSAACQANNTNISLSGIPLGGGTVTISAGRVNENAAGATNLHEQRQTSVIMPGGRHPTHLSGEGNAALSSNFNISGSRFSADWAAPLGNLGNARFSGHVGADLGYASGTVNMEASGSANLRVDTPIDLSRLGIRTPIYVPQTATTSLTINEQFQANSPFGGIRAGVDANLPITHHVQMTAGVSGRAGESVRSSAYAGIGYVSNPNMTLGGQFNHNAGGSDGYFAGVTLKRDHVHRDLVYDTFADQAGILAGRINEEVARQASTIRYRGKDIPAVTGEQILGVSGITNPYRPRNSVVLEAGYNSGNVGISVSHTRTIGGGNNATSPTTTVAASVRF